MKCIRSKLVLWAIGLLAIFVGLSTFVPRVPLLTVLNGIFLGVSTAAVIVYSPVISYALKKPKFDRISMLAIGIGMLWLAMIGQRAYWIVWHAYGSPLSWQSNPFLAAMAFMSIIAGGLFVAAPGYPPSDDAPEIPMLGENRSLLMLLGAIGGLLAFSLSMYFE